MLTTNLTTESCHESAPLGLVASAGIADIIGDGVKSVSELAEATGIEENILSKSHKYLHYIILMRLSLDILDRDILELFTKA